GDGTHLDPGGEQPLQRLATGIEGHVEDVVHHAGRGDEVGLRLMSGPALDLGAVRRGLRLPGEGHRVPGRGGTADAVAGAAVSGRVGGGREGQSRTGRGEQQGLAAAFVSGRFRSASAQPLGEFALPAGPTAELRAHLSPRLAVLFPQHALWSHLPAHRGAGAHNLRRWDEGTRTGPTGSGPGRSHPADPGARTRRPTAPAPGVPRVAGRGGAPAGGGRGGGPAGGGRGRGQRGARPESAAATRVSVYPWLIGPLYWSQRWASGATKSSRAMRGSTSGRTCPASCAERSRSM